MIASRLKRSVTFQRYPKVHGNRADIDKQRRTLSPKLRGSTRDKEGKVVSQLTARFAIQPSVQLAGRLSARAVGESLHSKPRK